MKIGLKHKNKRVNLEVKKVSAFGKFSGLMFSRREKAENLLFDFDEETRIAIHSIFVFFPFYAIWIDKKGKIVEIQKVPSWKLRVVPRSNFSKLLEIPANKKNSKIIEFLDGS